MESSNTPHAAAAVSADTSNTAQLTEAELRKHMREVEDAIAHLKGKQQEGQELVSLDLPKARQHYIIDTQVKRVACPVCFEDILESALRKHMATDCGGNEVVCPAIGCRERMPARELTFHLEQKCPVARRRRWLAKQAKTREAERRTLEATRQEEALLRRRTQAKEARVLRQRRWPPPTDMQSGAGPDDKDPLVAVEVQEEEGEAEVNELNVDSQPQAEKLNTSTELIKIKEPHLQCEQCCHIIILGLDSPEDSGAPVGDLSSIERQLRRKLQAHAAQECPMRAVCCPNRQFGCHETVAIGKIQQHLKTQCVYEKMKDALIKRSKQRRELVMCSGCGDPQQLMLLKKHEQTECPNRRVPCRNWHLGCPVQVRVRERHLHEDVTIDNTTRSCVYFGGAGARMKLEEDDIVPPWTMEFWMYRPSAEESAKYYIRECVHWRLHLLACKEKENLANKATEDCKTFLQGCTEAMARMVTEEERDVTFNQVQGAALALSNASFAAEDAVLDSEVAVERMKILIESAMVTLKMVLDKAKLLPVEDQTALVTLKDNMTRPPPKKKITKEELLESWRASKISATGSVDLALAKGSASGLDISADSTHPDVPIDNDLAGPSAAMSNEGEVDANPEPVPEAAYGEEEAQVQQHLDQEEEVEDDAMAICLSWPDWKWKVENLREELTFIQSEMEAWRENNQIDWRPISLKPVSLVDSSAPPTPQKLPGDGDEEDGIEPAGLSKKEKKALAKERKAKAKQRREEKKLRDSLRASAEEGEEGNPSGANGGEPSRKLLRDRIFEAVRRIQCMDNILSSSHGNISLNIAGTGRVGIFNALAPLMTAKEKKKSKMKPSDFRDGVQAFDVAVDREKWTHVALVCSKLPKDTLVLYLDGTPMETLPLAACNLPMKTIGDSKFSYHGFILDIRLWAKPRNTREIKASMHDVVQFEIDASPSGEGIFGQPSGTNTPSRIGSYQFESGGGASFSAATSRVGSPRAISTAGSRPNKTASNGLIAWWPFEDGLGLEESDIGPKVVLDVTEYRFKTPLASNARSVLRWVSALEVPELMARIPPPVEEPEPAKEHGVLLNAATQPGVAVPKNINRDELPCPSFREKNVCPYEIRRFYLAKRGRALMSLFPCPLECGEYVKKMDLKFHIRYLCQNRRMKCRFEDECEMSYFAHAQAYHERYECQRLDARNEIIEAAGLKNMLEACELCGEPVRIRDVMEHNQEQCPFRIVPCQFSDCKDPIPANQLKHHLKFECRSKELKRITVLVSKARKRLNYPRPWGIEMTLDNIEGEQEGDAAEGEGLTAASEVKQPDDEVGIVVAGDNDRIQDVAVTNREMGADDEKMGKFAGGADLI